MSFGPAALRLRPVATVSRHTTLIASQPFSTNPVHQKKGSTQSYENVVPPESPRYIRYYQPPQNEEVRPQRVRGKLPKPRQIFSKDEGQRKISQAFLEQTVSRGRDREPTSDVQAQKKRMADYRRRNLETGIQALWKRKSQRDARRSAESERVAKANFAARDAPELRADIMTRGTIHSSILDTSVKANPERFANVDRSRTRVALKEAAKREARRDALMELYVNARNFIVTEQELKAEVDEIFSEDYFRKQGQVTGRYGMPENVWGVHGPPPTVQQMMRNSMGQSSVGDGLSSVSPAQERAAKRQKRIAEEFTGGKMES